jgi:hypothetical protein
MAAIFDWIRRRRAAKASIDADATALMQEFVLDAYQVARERAIAARRRDGLDSGDAADHWDHVRAEIGRRTRRNLTDTATRYLTE